MAKENNNYDLVHPEGHNDVGKDVLKVLAAVIADKQNLGLHEKWNENYKLLRNKHWKSKSTSTLPLTTANFIFTHVQRTVNTLTDNNPTFNVAQIGALDESEKEFCLDLQRCTEHWWIDQEQQDKLEGSIRNGELYGATINKVVFNPDAEYGLGEVETINVDPFHFGWYPVKLKDPADLQKCEAVLHYYPQSVRSLRREYPDLAEKIKPDSDVLKELEDDRRDINSLVSKKGEKQNVSISGVIQTLINFLTSGDDQEGEETIVCEMWLRDKTQVAEGEPREDKTGRTVQDYKSKYTGEIRYIKVCSGGITLEDKDNPNINTAALSMEQASKTYLYDKFPFVVVNSVKDTSNAWGISDIEQIEWLNKELNKSLSQFVLEKDRMIRAKLLNPVNSGVTNDELLSYRSVVNPVSPMMSDGIRWLTPPPPTGDVEKAIQMFKDLLLLIAGTFDLDQAQVQGREVIAYKAIAAILERSATMQRGKIRGYGRLIREDGRMYLSHVMNFYTEERWITYNEKDGQRAAKAITGTNMVIPAKLTVVNGSTLPVSRVQQREEAIDLYGKGAIDQQELLEKLDWSNRNDVIKRMMAGPLAAVLDAMAKAGAPPQLLDYIQGISQADPKKLDQQIKNGEIPPFQQIAPALLGQDQEVDQPPDPELIKAQAEAKKIEAEAALTTAKIQTEAVNQAVALAGVKFDEENMKLERAIAVAEMEKNVREHNREDMKAGAEIVSNLNNQPGYNEKGMKSNNKEK